ncbi:hypothetical protein [Paenibacillus elgii]|uniref:hypothetical protein n=1 Tax=Paenibacillus elgii TaxID=189691 RepID=UPI0011125E25|nr:hypothetical protein [Paenibacillus elgii]
MSDRAVPRRADSVEPIFQKKTARVWGSGLLFLTPFVSRLVDGEGADQPQKHSIAAFAKFRVDYEFASSPQKSRLPSGSRRFTL